MGSVSKLIVVLSVLLVNVIVCQWATATGDDRFFGSQMNDDDRGRQMGAAAHRHRHHHHDLQGDQGLQMLADDADREESTGSVTNRPNKSRNPHKKNVFRRGQRLKNNKNGNSLFKTTLSISLF